MEVKKSNERDGILRLAPESEEDEVSPEESFTLS
jgi:hypothetical protein